MTTKSPDNLTGSQWIVRNSLGQIVGRFATQSQAIDYKQSHRVAGGPVEYDPNGDPVSYH